MRAYPRTEAGNEQSVAECVRRYKHLCVSPPIWQNLSATRSNHLDTAQPIPDSSDNETANKSRRLRGVDGWLLWLCLALTIFGPLLSAPSLLKELARLGNFSTRAQMWIFAADCAKLAVIVFGICAGIRLWRVKPGAVPLAQAALASGPIVDIVIQLAFTIAFGRVWDMSRTSSAVISALIWIWYLGVSERVHNTYEHATNSDLSTT